MRCQEETELAQGALATKWVKHTEELVAAALAEETDDPV